jgi:hypothetical protein
MLDEKVLAGDPRTPRRSDRSARGQQTARAAPRPAVDRRRSRKCWCTLGSACTRSRSCSRQCRARQRIWRQKAASLRTSASATACGVVTSRARGALAAPSSSSQVEMCSSDVPGGVSTMRKSSSPHSTSSRNWRITAFFFGPRQMIGSSALLANRSNTTNFDHYNIQICTFSTEIESTSRPIAATHQCKDRHPTVHFVVCIYLFVCILFVVPC